MFGRGLNVGCIIAMERTALHELFAVAKLCGHSVNDGSLASSRGQCGMFCQAWLLVAVVRRKCAEYSSTNAGPQAPHPKGE